MVIMKKSNLFFILSGIITAIITRIIIPFQNVFTSSGIRFNTIDAYFMVRQAKLLPNFQEYDYFRNYPEGVNAFQYQIFPSLIYTLSKIFNIDIEVIAAILPVILFFITVFFVYLIAKVLFNVDIAALSVFIVCILPGEILHRTSLGAADYHCFEILLMTALMAFIILAIAKKDFFYIFMALFAFIVYYFAWAGALISIFILVIAIMAYSLLKYPKNSGWIVPISLIALYVFIPQELINTGIGIFLISLQPGTIEEESLFFTNGQFDLTIQMAYFGICFYIVLFGIGWLLYRVIKYKNFNDILFFVWSMVTLLLMIAHRRFEYYFGINAAIITAFMLYNIYQIAKPYINRILLIAIFTLTICLPLVRQSVIVSMKTDNYYITEDWQDVCNWLADQKTIDTEKPYYGILTHADYGYWITEISNSAVYNDTGQFPKYYEIFTMTDYEKAKKQCRNITAKYIIIDKNMLYDKLSTIMFYSNVPPEDTFMFDLYNYQKSVYQSGDIKIFKMY